jgi:WD40 repeat protein
VAESTIWKIFADEIPLCHINPADFIELVARQGVRPERPDDEDASQFPDAVWELAEECWVKNPKQRPTAIAVRDTISNLLTPTTIFQPTTDSPLSPCTALPFLPPQQHVAGQGSPPVSLNLPLNLIMQGHTAEVFCAAFSHDGKSIVSGSRDCTIIVWDAQTGNVVKRPPRVHTKRVRCVAFSPNGKQIASGSADSTILVWDAATGQVVAGPFQVHTNAIWSVCFSPDGKKIASASSDQTIRVWDAQMGRLLVDPLGGHTDGVNSVAFSGDGKRLASGSRDRTIKIWDVKSGRLILGPLRGPECRVLFVAFSPDGKRTISASEDGDVCIWDTNTGTLLSGPSKQHTEGTLAVVSTPNSTHYCAVSPDGKWIALQVAGHCHSVQVWDSKTGGVVETFTKHTKHIRSVSFSSDSKRILSSSDDETVRTRTLDWYPVSLTCESSYRGNGIH